MRFFLFLVPLFLNCTIAPALNTDSLFRVAKNKSLPEQERYKAIAILEKKYKTRNADTCLLLADLLLKDFRQTDSLVASTLLLKGTTYYLKGSYDTCLLYFKAALQKEKKVGRITKFAALFNNLSAAYERKGQYDSSLVYAIKSLEILEKSGGAALNKAMALYSIGNTYRKLKEHAKALPYFEEALAIAEKENDKTGQAACNNNIGNIYNGLKNYKKALVYFDKAYVMYSSVNDSFGMSSALNNKGISYMVLEDRQQARKFYNQAYLIRKKINDVNGLSYSTTGLAETDYLLGNYSSAVRLFHEGLQLYEHTGVVEGILRCYKGLEQAYRKSGNTERAYEFVNKYYALKDSVYDLEKMKQLNSLEARYQNEKKSLEIEKLNSEKMLQQNILKKQEAESKRQQLLIYLVAAVALGVSTIAIIIFRTLRITRRQKTVIELQKQIVEDQKTIVEEKQKEILDSIYYARRIQRALLAPEKYIDRTLNKLRVKKKT